MKTKSLALIGFACCVTSLVLAQSSSDGESPRAASFHRLESSGVFGESVWEASHIFLPGGSSLPLRVFSTTNSLPTTITVRRATGRYVTTIQTDEQGRFQAQLRPGRYILTPEVHVIPRTPDEVRVLEAQNPVLAKERLKVYADPARVVVSRGRLKHVTIIYGGLLPFTLP